MKTVLLSKEKLESLRIKLNDPILQLEKTDFLIKTLMLH